MKKFIIIYIILVFGTLAKSQDLEFASISGTFNKAKLQEINLSKIVEGKSLAIASSKLNSKKKFGFMFQPEKEGFYLLGGESVRSDAILIYIKSGDKLNIEVNDSSYTLIGKNSIENEILSKWYIFTSVIRKKSYILGSFSIFEDFFPELEKIAEQAKPWLKKHKSGNKKFDNLMEVLVERELDYIALNFIFSPRMKHPAKEQLPSFYNTISTDRLKTTDLLITPFASNIINHYVLMDYMRNGSFKDYSFDKAMASIPNDTLKGVYLLLRCEKIQEYGEYIELMEKYGHCILTDYQKERETKISSGLITLKKGEKAIDFTYKDINGKEVSLSDFKDKVVLVDVWATWCGPCLKTMPALIELEKELDGKDIVFIGVSVDTKKEKWEGFLKKKSMAGIQIWANGWSKITQAYRIKGIPRLMIFDQEGKIVTVDAPRPSQPELKKLLLETLNKQG